MPTVEKATPTPKSYEEAYPGRFLSAGHLDGKHVTLTIKNVQSEALGPDGGKESGKAGRKKQIVISFAGTEMQLVCAKTNALCLRTMFGSRIANWLGKKVTFFPTVCRFGLDPNVPCIRIWGSPELANDMEFTLFLGGRKPEKMTLHCVERKASAGELVGTNRPSELESSPRSEAAPQMEPVDPAVAEAWSLLGWSPAAGAADRARFSGTTVEYLTSLSRLLDEQSASEGEV